MKSKKAQFELSPIPVVMGVLGVILAWIMASRMEAGIFMKIISVVITGIACYFLAYFISNK